MRIGRSCAESIVYSSTPAFLPFGSSPDEIILHMERHPHVGLCRCLAGPTPGFGWSGLGMMVVCDRVILQ